MFSLFWGGALSFVLLTPIVCSAGPLYTSLLISYPPPLLAFLTAIRQAKSDPICWSQQVTTCVLWTTSSLYTFLKGQLNTFCRSPTFQMATLPLKQLPELTWNMLLNIEVHIFPSLIFELVR